MKVAELQTVAKIAAKISNSSSLSPLYRSTQICDMSVRACSEHGNVELEFNSGLTKSCLLDTAAICAVAFSLDGGKELTFAENADKIDWRCGKARGHLALVQQEEVIPDVLSHTSFPWKLPDKLADALLIASSACQAATVSIGIYGIVIEPQLSGTESCLALVSSNSISLARVRIPIGDYPGRKITVRPPVPSILATILDSYKKNCALDVTDKGIFVQGWSTDNKLLVAELPLSPSLDHDLFGIAEKHSSATQTIKIDLKEVRTFLSRAKLLIDKHTDATITMKIEKGEVLLEQTGVAASSSESFAPIAQIVNPALTFASVSLPIELMMIPLEQATTLVLDYLDQKKLILRGDNPEFLYVIGGS